MGSAASLFGVPDALPHRVPGPQRPALQLPGGAILQQQWQAMLRIPAASPEPSLKGHACLVPIEPNVQNQAAHATRCPLLSRQTAGQDHSGILSALHQ